MALDKYYPEHIEPTTRDNKLFCDRWWQYVVQLRSIEGYSQVSFRESPCTWTFIRNGEIVTVNSLGEVERLRLTDDSDDFMMNMLDDNF